MAFTHEFTDALFSLERFRRVAAENREREAARAAAFEAWWQAHADAREREVRALRSQPVVHEAWEVTG